MLRIDDPFIGLRIIGKDKTRRLGRGNGLFQLVHSLQLIDAGERALRRRGSNKIAIDVILQLCDLLLLLLIFPPLLL